MEGILSKLVRKGIPELESHLELIRSIDWASTSLGNLDSWPLDIAFMFHLAMMEPQPRLMLLGSENTMIYNVAYSDFLGEEKHPTAMGRPFIEVWGEAAVAAQHWYKAIKTTGHAYEETALNLMIKRNGLLESCYVSFSVIPLPSTSPVTGYVLSLREVTEKVIADYRSSALEALSVACSTATSLKSIWQKSLECFQDRPFHYPFAIIYTARAPANSEQASKPEDCQTYQFRGSVGKFDQPLAEFLDPESDVEPFVRSVREAIVSKEPVLLQKFDGTLPESMSRAPLQRGYNEICSAAVVVPIRSYASLKVRGLIVLGLSTRRPWNAAYRSWMLDISRSLGEAATSIVMSEEGARREQDAAEALAMSEKEASAMSGRLERLMTIMERSDVGVFECSMDGKLSWANSAWYKLSGYPEDVLPKEFSWLDYVFPEDIDKVMRNWKLLHQGTPATYELRWKRPGGKSHWVLAVCLPVIDDNGVVISVSGTTTDISLPKRVELVRT